MLENMQLWIATAGGLLLIVLFLYCLVLQSKINSLSKRYDYFMRGENGSSLERKLSVEVKELRDAAESIESLFQQQEAIQATQHNTFQKIGFVKYNAFENIGNDLSFSVTLLDGNNNGICISVYMGAVNLVFLVNLLLTVKVLPVFLRKKWKACRKLWELRAMKKLLSALP